MKKRTLLVTFALAAAIIVTGCGGGGGEATTETAPAPADTSAPGAAPAADGPTGTVSGTISYVNGDPDGEIQMGADPVCAGLHSEPVETEKVVQADGKLANVFVYVKEGVSGSWDPPADAHLLDQIGCRYTPHVSGMMVGQTLTIRNSDPTLHNVHAMPEANEEFNNGQPFQGMELEKVFDQPEIMIPFKCDVHPWMAAYMAVLEHPFFAVSAADGTYTIDNLPAGDYVVEAWHETLGAQTLNVTVEADAAATASFEYAPAAG